MEPTNEDLLAELVRSLEVMAQGVKDIAETLDAIVVEGPGSKLSVRVTSE